MMWIILAAVAMVLPPVPGVINPNVNQSNIQQTICKSGWTGTVRPPLSYTEKLKKQQMKTYNLRGRISNYEEDHLISLELGGSPTDPNNLWPEYYSGTWGAKKKDVLERKLNRMICRGQISLQEAQTAISTNWVNAYKKYIGA